jgi:RNA recognition motif-containing protein
MIKARSRSIPRDKKTYTCWIGNITSRIERSILKEDLNRLCGQFGCFKSPIDLKYVDTYQKCQCFIKYYEEKSVFRAVSYFNNMEFYDDKLKAKYITEREISVPPTNRNSLLVKKLQPEPISQLYLVKSLVILNSKYLRQQINKKVEILRNVYNDKLIINIDNSGVESDVIINLKTFDENVLSNVNKLIEKSWIVRINTFDLQETDKKLLSALDEDIKKTSIEYDVHIDINEQNKNVSVYGFDNQKADDAQKKIVSIIEKIATQDLSRNVSTLIENLNILTNETNLDSKIPL